MHGQKNHHKQSKTLYRHMHYIERETERDTEKEKLGGVYVHYLTDKGLISQVHKELLKTTEEKRPKTTETQKSEQYRQQVINSHTQR